MLTVVTGWPTKEMPADWLPEQFAIVPVLSIEQRSGPARAASVKQTDARARTATGKANAPPNNRNRSRRVDQSDLRTWLAAVAKHPPPMALELSAATADAGAEPLRSLYEAIPCGTPLHSEHIEVPMRVFCYSCQDRRANVRQGAPIKMARLPSNGAPLLRPRYVFRTSGAALFLLFVLGITSSIAQSQDGPQAWRVECTGDGRTLECKALQQLINKDNKQLIAQLVANYP